MKYIFYILIIVFFGGCATGHQAYVNMMNDNVGVEMLSLPTKPYKYKNAGKLVRANYLIGGEGLTHITKDKDDNIVYHYSGGEVLDKPNVAERFVGKCLTYQVVDPETKIILSWGFDEGGNPQSCRFWP